MSTAVKATEGRGKHRSAKDIEERQDEAKAKIGEDESKCGTCNKPVGDKDKGVYCEICELWFHCHCQSLSEVLYNALSQFNSELHWFCNSCNTGAGKLLITISKMHAKVEKLEDEMVRTKAEFHACMVQSVTAIRDDLAKLEGRIEQCEKNVDGDRQKLHSNVNIKLAEFESKLHDCSKTPPQWSDIVSKEVETKMSEVTADITAVHDAFEKTKVLIQEQKDKEARANNVIVYNIAETTVTDRKDWMVQEKNYCLKLFNEILDVKVKSEDIKRMLRLGKLEDNKSRPVLIEFRDKTIKNQIIEWAPKLRLAPDLYNKVIIGHDMTVAERAECKKLVNDAKDLEANDHSGDWIYRVRGYPGQMRIVRLRRAY